MKLFAEEFDQCCTCYMFQALLRAGTHLFEGSLGSEEFVEKADRNAEHGGQSHTPANHLTPPRVHVHIVVGQGLIVHHVEQKDTLQMENRRVDTDVTTQQPGQ